MGTDSGSPYTAAVDENTMAVDAVRLHSSQHLGWLGRVRPEVLLGLRHGLGDLDVAREMHDGIAARKHRVEDSGVAHGSLHELGTRVDGGAVSALQGVEDDTRVTSVLQHTRGDGTDVAGAAGDQNPHLRSLRLRLRVSLSGSGSYPSTAPLRQRGDTSLQDARDPV